ncbi:TPA: hypothetical protein DDY56_03210 [Candidatus Uhrbacteria bacterium]|nr:MAG: hypothetical protein A2317_03625 [Candidatus Uhrbacteria bacterium RIFOXYB2_FULL_41_10]HBJ62597.1 hypothetical protein [Candidatus Uhrbacteria bacterium]
MRDWLLEANRRILGKNPGRTAIHNAACELIDALTPCVEQPSSWFTAFDTGNSLFEVIGTTPYTVIGVGRIELRNSIWQDHLKRIRESRTAFAEGRISEDEARRGILIFMGSLEYLCNEANPFADVLAPLVPPWHIGHW